MSVPINLTGGSYKHRSLPLSNQVTRNFWPQLQQNEKERSRYILQSFYGQKAFGSQSGGTDRGMFEHQGVVYKITGTTLYTVASDGTHTSRGSIPGSERCRFSALGSSIVVNTSTTRYQWNGSVLAEVSDSDVEDGAGLASLNSQMIYGGTGARFGVSDVGDATSVDGLNYATAESDASNLVTPYVFKQTLYLMKQKSIEPWYNSGQGNPPFDRYDGAIINIGLAAIDSVANDDDFMFFLGDDRKVYTLRGSAAAVVKDISTQPMATAFADYETIDDAIGWTMLLEGQSFYVLTFPTEDVSWVYPVGGEWFEWGSGASGRNRANSYVYAFNKHLVADYQSGAIYELDKDTFTEGGDEIIRLRDSAPIHGGLFQLDGKELEMNRLEIIMETGVGTLSGQGSNPVVMLSWSDDGGRTFSAEQWGEVGVLGEFQKKVEFKNLGRFESRILRIRVSDPVYWAIYSCVADIEACI